MKTIVVEEMPDLFWELLEKSKIENVKSGFNFPKNEVEIIILRTQFILNCSIIDEYPNLKFVIRAGTGVDNIAVHYAYSKGIKVFNTPNANAHSAFEQTISHIFSLIKNSKKSDDNIFKGNWKKDLPFNLEVIDLKILIVGFGRVGKKVYDLLSSLGASIRIYDPFISSHKIKNQMINDFSEGLNWCNLVTFHCPLYAQTHQMLDFSKIEKTPHPFYLVNCARGNVIDFDAVLKGLKSGKIIGAGIDVFEKEPMKKKLEKIPNLILSPHIGAYTKNAKNRMAVETIQTLASVINNEKIEEVDLRFV